MQLLKQDDLQLQWQFFLKAITGDDFWKLLIAVSLVFLNWGIEAMKWRQVIAPLQKLTFFQAFKATLAGVALALNTPNRIGEYGARILFMEEGKRVKAIPLTVISSFSQLVITMLAGIIALGLMIGKLDPIFWWLKSQYMRIFVLMVFILLTVGFILIYFRIANVMEWFLKIRLINKFSQYFHEVKNLSKKILWGSFGLSFCRYVVFIFQYILLLQLMQVIIPFWHAVGIVSILFLFLAVIPTVAILELGIRWQLGLMLFGLYSHNVLGIYMVGTAIWILNLLIPSIFGSLSILRIRIFNLKE